MPTLLAGACWTFWYALRGTRVMTPSTNLLTRATAPTSPADTKHLRRGNSPGGPTALMHRHLPPHHIAKRAHAFKRHAHRARPSSAWCRDLPTTAAARISLAIDLCAYHPYYLDIIEPTMLRTALSRRLLAAGTRATARRADTQYRTFLPAFCDTFTARQNAGRSVEWFWVYKGIISSCYVCGHILKNNGDAR